MRKYFLTRVKENQGSPRRERERLRRQKAEFKTQFMSPLHQRTTDSLQSAPLSLKPGSTLVDNLWTLMDNWWTGDGCQPFHIRFLFRQCQCQPELYSQTLYKRQNNYNDNDNGIGRAQTESEENALFYLLKGPFPHSRFGHFH